MSEDSRAAYMKAYRKTPAGKAQVRADAIRSKARRDAMAELAARHESEFEDIFRDKLRAAILADREKAIKEHRP